MPSFLGLKKKLTRDSNEHSGATGSPLTTTVSNRSADNNNFNTSAEAPTTPSSQHGNAVSGHNNMNTSSEQQQKGIYPSTTQQGKPAVNGGQQSGIRPMADGTWPVQRDAKATKGKYALGDFNFQRTLGTGSFGRVHLVQSKHNQRFYAVKVLKKAQVVKMKQVEHTNDERRMLARVKHPFLITLWGTFSDSKNLYMVMDFVEGGELFSLLRKSQVRTGLQL